MKEKLKNYLFELADMVSKSGTHIPKFYYSRIKWLDECKSDDEFHKTAIRISGELARLSDLVNYNKNEYDLVKKIGQLVHGVPTEKRNDDVVY